jgi:hypothetical protein
MNPVFSASHIRNMVSQFYAVSHKVSANFLAVVRRLIFYQLCNALTLELSEGDKDVDILMWMSRAAMELIGEVGAILSRYAGDLRAIAGRLGVFFRSAD